MNKYEIIEGYGGYWVKFKNNHVTIEVFDTLEEANNCIEKLNSGIWFI